MRNRRLTTSNSRVSHPCRPRAEVHARTLEGPCHPTSAGIATRRQQHGRVHSIRQLDRDPNRGPNIKSRSNDCAKRQNQLSRIVDSICLCQESKPYKPTRCIPYVKLPPRSALLRAGWRWAESRTGAKRKRGDEQSKIPRPHVELCRAFANVSCA